jgi:hypothetical protein
MKNGAAAEIKKITYGVSIGQLPLQVAKTREQNMLTPNWAGIN